MVSPREAMLQTSKSPKSPTRPDRNKPKRSKERAESCRTKTALKAEQTTERQNASALVGASSHGKSESDTTSVERARAGRFPNWTEIQPVDKASMAKDKKAGGDTSALGRIRIRVGRCVRDYDA